MEKVKKDAFRYYKRWRREKTFSPAFKEEVRVSLKGWRHITGAAGAKKRNINDIYRRLMLLPHAKAIIKKATTIQNIVKRKGQTYYVLEEMRIVEERGRKTQRKVRVVLEEDRKGKKVFLSVMDKKHRKKGRKKKPWLAS